MWRLWLYLTVQPGRLLYCPYLFCSAAGKKRLFRSFIYIVTRAKQGVYRLNGGGTKTSDFLFLVVKFLFAHQLGVEYVEKLNHS